MRQIQKRIEPRNLTTWRAAHAGDVNFGYGLIDGGLRLEIKLALLTEQGGICAYTGRSIAEETCHVEHLRPQCHCSSGEAVAYQNMVACLPAPGSPQLPYGAHKKGDWPDPSQEHLFVSPLRANCGERFCFNLQGEIQPRNAHDMAARETISHLGLDHPQLNQFRKAAIDGTLGLHGRGRRSLDLSSARRRLRALATSEHDNGPLEPFCFVLRQALEKHIRRVAAVRASKRGQP
jgi:uncharacterized protein (TIGR02646 family)